MRLVASCPWQWLTEHWLQHPPPTSAKANAICQTSLFTNIWEHVSIVLVMHKYWTTGETCELINMILLLLKKNMRQVTEQMKTSREAWWFVMWHLTQPILPSRCRPIIHVHWCVHQDRIHHLIKVEEKYNEEEINQHVLTACNSSCQ